jgi:hypothetical protein
MNTGIGTNSGNISGEIDMYYYLAPPTELVFAE